MPCKDCYYYKTYRCHRPDQFHNIPSVVQQPQTQSCDQYIKREKSSWLCRFGHKFDAFSSCRCLRCGYPLGVETEWKYSRHHFERKQPCECYEYCAVCGARGKYHDHDYEGCTCRGCGKVRDEGHVDVDCVCKYCGKMNLGKHRFHLVGIHSFWEKGVCEKDINFDGGACCDWCTDRVCNSTHLSHTYIYQCEVCGDETRSFNRKSDGETDFVQNVFFDDPAITEAAADVLLNQENSETVEAAQ